jgi:hypothetical protein
LCYNQNRYRAGFAVLEKRSLKPMSVRVMKEIIFVAMGDENFRYKLVFEPDETLSQYDLTQEEYKSLRLGDKEKMVNMGLDENLAQYAYLMFSKRR